MNRASLDRELLDRVSQNSTTHGKFHFSLDSNFALHQAIVKVLDWWLNHFVVEDALGQFNGKGRDLAIFLKQSKVLEDELGRKVFKKILKEIERYDWVAKFEIYLEIGQYFNRF